MKKFILMIMLTVLAVNVNAQKAYEAAKLFDNTSIGLLNGVTTPLSFNSVFPVNPTVGLRLGKDFTPIFGVNVEGSGWLGSATDEQFRFDALKHYTFRGLNVGLNGTFNITNALAGYNGKPRTFELGLTGGLGWGHIFNKDAKDTNLLTAKTGLDFMFNLGKNKANILLIEPCVWWGLDNGGKIKMDKRNAQLGVQIGLIHKFKTSNGTHNFKAYDIGEYEARITRLNEELAKKPKVVEKTVEKKVFVKENNGVFSIPFTLRGATLTSFAIHRLDEVVSAVGGTDKVVDINGYASFERDVHSKYNRAVSEKRANAVADYLRSKGVKIRKVEWFGADKPESQRVVEVRVVE